METCRDLLCYGAQLVESSLEPICDDIDEKGDGNLGMVVHCIYECDEQVGYWYQIQNLTHKEIQETEISSAYV